MYFTICKGIYFYRPHTKYGRRYCFHRRVSLTLSMGRRGILPPGESAVQTPPRLYTPPPWPDTHPRTRQNMVNWRPIRILLECILVPFARMLCLSSLPVATEVNGFVLVKSCIFSFRNGILFLVCKLIGVNVSLETSFK